MDTQSIEDIIRYALIVASKEDYHHERRLGPIHFIKYVYIADMEYARYHGGKTFTGVEWMFYRFGPWSQEVNSLIEPALTVLGATKEQLPSSYGDSDYVRWRLEDDETAHVSMTVSRLPLAVKAPIDKYVHKFGNDTSALLHFVYATPPMLGAAPGEVLDFSVMVKEPGLGRRESGGFVPFLERLSKSGKTLLTSRMEELRKSFRKRLEAKDAERTASPQPEFDTVYEEGVKWLDGLAGPAFPQGSVDVTIDQTVWKSEARSGSE